MAHVEIVPDHVGEGDPGNMWLINVHVGHDPHCLRSADRVRDSHPRLREVVASDQHRGVPVHCEQSLRGWNGQRTKNIYKKSEILLNVMKVM